MTLTRKLRDWHCAGPVARHPSEVSSMSPAGEHCKESLSHAMVHWACWTCCAGCSASVQVIARQLLKVRHTDSAPFLWLPLPGTGGASSARASGGGAAHASASASSSSDSEKDRKFALIIDPSIISHQ